ncbi:unnamed protein product [Rhizophagus irregularis]|nr:unnamed protein product [Rhizophagus irregularis]
MSSSGNKKIDDFILNINFHNNVIFEWIPYNQFNEIKETGNNGSITVYSAIWKDGPLNKKFNIRDSNKEVALKCLHNLQNPVDSLINEAKKYSILNDEFLVLYGISQNPDTSDYILVLTWTSGNEKIDSFIQRMQNEIVFEWIPYNQFNEIKKTGKNGSITVYSAIWRNGPLQCQYNVYTRNPYKEVALKCLHNLQNPVDSLINEAKKYSIINYEFLGISQNPDTSDYILVLTWTSGNEKIDSFIQEMQFKMNDVVFQWIPYNQFNEIKETGKNGSITVYSAIWRNGPLYYRNHTRDSNKEVALKCLHNLQNPVDSLINEAKKYSINYEFLLLYGISQNPDTSDYILALTWTSGNEKIDYFIQERQLNINFINDVVFEWIPYNQFNEMKETGKNGSITVYSAIWKNGPLHYRKHTRDSNKEVALKFLHNLQNPVDSLINEAKKYSAKNDIFLVLYGISQNPDTSDYILVQNYLILSGNEEIDNFIQERQLNNNSSNDVVFEWIPYNQFIEIKETGKNGSITVYLAIWKNGPLHKELWWYTRDSNKKVVLKCLHNLQNPVDSLINEVKKYSTKNNEFLCGISQNPDTSDYILVLSGNKKIDDFIQERQLNIDSYNDDAVFEWIPYNQFNEIKEIGKNDSITVYSAIWKNGPLCKDKEVALKYLHNLQNPVDSLINQAKKYPTLCGISQNPVTDDYILVLTWTSRNKKIDNFIQESQLNINSNNDVIFEWIPYNQFNEIKETGKNGSITVYSAIWRNGNKEVALKCLHNLQNPVDFLINEAKKYSAKNDMFLVLYGISQNLVTSDYILVLTWTSGNEKIDDFIQKSQFNINSSNNVVFEWIPYNQFNEIKKTGKNSSITVYSAIWKNGPLIYDSFYSEYIRKYSNKEVALKCLHNLQNPVDSLINEAKKYSAKNNMFLVLYGISQNPDTSDYILYLNGYLTISLMKLKKQEKNGSITVYSAIWRNGPLHYRKHTRDSNKEVALKCFHNFQNPVDPLLINEAKKYSTKNKFLVLYGISQNPDTSDYILVLTWTSGNEKIDDFIQERQLNFNFSNDVVFEWIPYNQFNEIKKTGKNDSIAVYSAIWKNGPLQCQHNVYTRNPNKEVALKYLHNLLDPIEYLINHEIRKYLTNNKFHALYGMSQNPDTNDYFLILNNSVNLINWMSGNEKIDNFIQEMQFKLNDVVFEWIPYNQFNEIKEISKNSSITFYSECIRDSNKEVALKCLHNLQNPVDSLVNEAKRYSTKNDKFLVLYGISQNPDTSDYILVQNYLILSGNKIIDNFIQERQLNINSYNDVIFEWIPYNQFNEIEETGKNNSITVYSAIWKNGPLLYDNSYSEYTRNYTNKEVALKCFHNLQNPVDFLINKV